MTALAFAILLAAFGAVSYAVKQRRVGEGVDRAVECERSRLERRALEVGLTLPTWAAAGGNSSHLYM